MKTSSSPIRARPPKLSTDAQKRLDKLEQWTEQPAREAAAALAPEVVAEKGQGRAPAQKPQEDWPWIEFEGVPAMSGFLVRIPKSLHLKVKFLGETTYGDSMNKLVQRAIEHEVKLMLKARGIKS